MEPVAQTSLDLPITFQVFEKKPKVLICQSTHFFDNTGKCVFCNMTR